jgi:hypothetical protein
VKTTPEHAPGAVQVRLSGEREDIEMVASLLACAGAEIITRSGPRANRTDPGVRVYMVVRVPPGDVTAGGTR